MKPLIHPDATALPRWQPTHRGEIAIQLRLDRGMLIALLVSLLLHLLLLANYAKKLLEPNDDVIPAPPLVMQLELARPKAKPEPLPAPPAIEPPPKPTSPPKPAKTPKPEPLPKVRTTPAPSPLQLPAETPPVRTQVPPTPNTPQNAPTDLASYMAMRREQRRQEEESAARENAAHAAKERLPTESERRDEIIRRNLQPGTNGLFQIVNLSQYTAQFTFKGWTTNASNARREFFQIEADVNEDIKRKVVQKMIEIIRRHYQGDFNWESQRLDRVVVLSARPEDNAGLEDFLIMEFFGARR